VSISLIDSPWTSLIALISAQPSTLSTPASRSRSLIEPGSKTPRTLPPPPRGGQ
jgi:hypothetical protein